MTGESTDDARYLVVWFYHSSYDTDISETEILDSLQIEIGTDATDYSEYVGTLNEIPIIQTDGVAIKTVMPNAIGTVSGLKSLSPYFSISAQASGVIIDCEYNVDLKKYIDKRIGELTTQ